ncbi:radical SAM protein [Haliangium ochraceum]|uniref:Radical SAM domain protein n=1 Tax=Haliangium ochraceum (strain DSM 14365 / JCM 11303 / SMP-2) TaxID=502025 RepID=D0LQG8_HALO1|nr:radical SAM protein [Haliangium ochraceum]ACY18977.1 Radical SAM domain protein [Haliangium ochraceum DSM 14365]
MWRALERMRAEGPDSPVRKLHVLGHSPWLSSAKLKLVDACNLRCFMCEYWKGRRRGELSTEEVTRVLDDLRALGCEKVHFTGGELFMRRDVLTLVAHAADLGMRTNLTTNGTLLTRETIKALLEIPVRSVTLSIDAPVARIHDTVRGKKGAHHKTTRSIDRLLRWRKSKTRVRVNTVLSRKNYRSLVEMGDYLRERPVDGWLLIPMDPWNDNDQAMRAEDIRFYNAHVAPILAETVRVPGFDPFVYGRSDADVAFGSEQAWARGHYREHPCRVPWFHTLIDARGDVYPCCMGHERLPKLGNIRERSIADIWHGPDYERFRRDMRHERTAVCHRCDDFLSENRAFDELERSWEQTAGADTGAGGAQP